jgi:E3 ubiquitin-protein ligase UBR4
MYYVTNTVEAKHDDIKEHNGSMNNGAVSIYYSFKLQMLFWSYQNGRTFMSSVVVQNNKTLHAQFKSIRLEKIFHLNQATLQVAAHKSTTTGQHQQQQQQALCNWTEISNHPGLVLAMTLISNNPVAIMIMPERILFQEIKLTGSAKSKIQDMVVTRHPGIG